MVGFYNGSKLNKKYLDWLVTGDSLWICEKNSLPGIARFLRALRIACCNVMSASWSRCSFRISTKCSTIPSSTSLWQWLSVNKIHNYTARGSTQQGFNSFSFSYLVTEHIWLLLILWIIKFLFGYRKPMNLLCAEYLLHYNSYNWPFLAKFPMASTAAICNLLSSSSSHLTDSIKTGPSPLANMVSAPLSV